MPGEFVLGYFSDFIYDIYTHFTQNLSYVHMLMQPAMYLIREFHS
jgi:hypothetical protein